MPSHIFEMSEARHFILILVCRLTLKSANTSMVDPRKRCVTWHL